MFLFVDITTRKVLIIVNWYILASKAVCAALCMGDASCNSFNWIPNEECALMQISDLISSDTAEGFIDEFGKHIICTFNVS